MYTFIFTFVLHMDYLISVGHTTRILIFCHFLTESRRASIDIFLKAAGYLDCAVKHVLPQLSSELRFLDARVHWALVAMYCYYKPLHDLKGYSCSLGYCSNYRRNLPVDLAEGVLRALCLQALGQVLVYSSMDIIDELLGCIYLNIKLHTECGQDSINM